MSAYLEGEEVISMVSTGFFFRSNGVITGAIGAIDGWLVKITRPSWMFDRVRNPISFFSRKGSYALNVQFIVDHDKKSYGHPLIIKVDLIILQPSEVTSFTIY